MIIKPWDTNHDGTTDFYTVILPPNHSSRGGGSSGNGDNHGCVVVGFLGLLCLMFLGVALKQALFPENSSPSEPAAVAVDQIPHAAAIAAPEVRQRVSQDPPLTAEPSGQNTSELIQAFFAIPFGDWKNRLSHIDYPVESEPWVRAFEEETIRRHPNSQGFKYDSVGLDFIQFGFDGIPEHRYKYGQKRKVTVRWFLSTPGHSGTFDVVVVRRTNGLKISWWDTYLPYLMELGWVDAKGSAVRATSGDH